MNNRPDFFDYVVHFTKGAAPSGAKAHATDESLKKIKGSGYDRLRSILCDELIYATPMPWTNKKAVAFTECPWGSLLHHAKRYSPYGIGFTKTQLFASGGGPAIYLRPDLHEKQKAFVDEANIEHKGFHSDLYAFVTPFAPEYAPKPWKDKHWKKGYVDFTHEREWRVPHDFKFGLTKIQFVIVDTYEDVAKFPKNLKDKIGREKFLIMDIYRQIEKIWPTHLV